MTCEEQLIDKIIELINTGKVSFGFSTNGNLNEISDLLEYQTNYTIPPRQIIMRVVLDDTKTLLLFSEPCIGSRDSRVSAFIQHRIGEFGDHSFNYDTILYDYDIYKTNKLHIVMMDEWHEYSKIRKQQSCQERINLCTAILEKVA